MIQRVAPAFRAPSLVTQALPSSLEPLDIVVRQGVEHICKLGDDDGLYRTLYLAGPFHTAGTSVALNYIGLKSPDFFESQTSSFKAMLALQNPDGSFSPYPGAKPSRSLTGFVTLGMCMAVKNGVPGMEAFRDGLSRAEAFTSAHADCHEPPMIDSMYRMMHDICVPSEPKLTPRYMPLTPTGARMLLHSKAGSRVAGRLSMAATLLTPASAIMAHHADRAGGFANLEDRCFNALGLRGVSERMRQKLVQDIEKTQDPTGGWAYITLAACVNMFQ